MIALLEAATAASDSWSGFVGSAVRGSAMLFALALLLWIPLRSRLPAQFGYALFLLVLVRLAAPVSFELPSSIAAMSPQYLADRAWDHWTAGSSEGPAAVATASSAMVAATGDPRAPAQPMSEAVDWTAFAFAAWVLVVGVLLAGFGWRQVRTTRLVRRARPVRPGELDPTPASLCRAAKLRRRVRFLVTRDVFVPAAGGLFRPYVLVPEGLMGELIIEQRRFVLLHELAHIRRGDLWVALFQRLVAIAFFFHPLVWWANRIIDEQREFAADDAALAACGGRKACGAGFLSVVEWAQGRACAPVGSLGMFRSSNAIRRRLMRILDGDRKVGGRSSTLCTLMVVALGAVLVPAVRAQEKLSDRDLQMEILRVKLTKLEAEGRILRLQMEQMRRQGDKPETVRGTARPSVRPYFRLPNPRAAGPREEEVELEVPTDRKGRYLFTPRAPKAGNLEYVENVELEVPSDRKGRFLFAPRAPKARNLEYVDSVELEVPTDHEGRFLFEPRAPEPSTLKSVREVEYEFGKDPDGRDAVIYEWVEIPPKAQSEIAEEVEEQRVRWVESAPREIVEGFFGSERSVEPVEPAEPVEPIEPAEPVEPVELIEVEVNSRSATPARRIFLEKARPEGSKARRVEYLLNPSEQRVRLDVPVKQGGATGEFRWGVSVSSDTGVQASILLPKSAFDKSAPPVAEPVILDVKPKLVHGTYVNLDLERAKAPPSSRKKQN